MDVWGWWDSLPRVTQVWFGAAVAVHAAVSLDALAAPAEQLLWFDWHSIYYDLELWRLLTAFLFTGGRLPEFHVLIFLYMITLHSAAYETNPHPVGAGGRRSAHPRADYVFCLGFCMVLTVVSYLVVDYYEPRYGNNTTPLLYPVFARTLVAAVMYLWSRRNPHVQINLNMIPIQGQYLPYAHVALSLMLGNHVGDLVHGMAVGHAYYYLVAVVPAMTAGRHHILTTPRILVDWLGGGEEDDHFQHQEDPDPDNHNRHIRQQRVFRDEGATPAHIAAKLGQLDDLRRLAAQDPSMMAATDRNDWQPLHEAVRGGHLPVVEFLLGLMDDDGDVVVDVNAVTKSGHTPLALALSFHGPHHPITMRLRARGATVQSESSSSGGDDSGDDDSDDDDDDDDDNNHNDVQ